MTKENYCHKSVSLFQHVKEAVVRIVVMANIQLNPPVVYLCQHTTVQYSVQIIKENKFHGW